MLLRCPCEKVEMGSRYDLEWMSKWEYRGVDGLGKLVDEGSEGGRETSRENVPPGKGSY